MAEWGARTERAPVRVGQDCQSQAEGWVGGLRIAVYGGTEGSDRGVELTAAQSMSR